MRLAIYPGTFDPITNGHIDIIDRAAELFDRVLVAVAANSQKTPLFSADDRRAMIEETFAGRKSISVEQLDGLLVARATERGAVAIVRGLRAVSDFEFEFQMALMNRKLAPAIATVFLMPHDKYTYLNSSIIREVARLGGDVREFVPAAVARRLAERFPSTAG
jgi:pantetheine-phosphate adenylyltransferase